MNQMEPLGIVDIVLPGPAMSVEGERTAVVANVHHARLVLRTVGFVAMGRLRNADCALAT